MTEKKIISVLCAVTAASFLFVGGWLMGRGSRSEGLTALSLPVSAEAGSSAAKERSEAAAVSGSGEAHGGFLQKEELLQVKGIGGKKFEALRELVEVNSSG